LIGKTYLPKPRLIDTKTGATIMIDRIHVDKPTEALISAYEEKKKAFISLNIHDWYSQLVAADNVQHQTIDKGAFLAELVAKVKACPDVYILRKRFSSTLIRAKEGVSRGNAEAAAALLNKDLQNTHTPHPALTLPYIAGENLISQ
jgi:hypothetical protein